jgi:hypothetical protein
MVEDEIEKHLTVTGPSAGLATALLKRGIFD